MLKAFGYICFECRMYGPLEATLRKFDKDGKTTGRVPVKIYISVKPFAAGERSTHVT